MGKLRIFTACMLSLAAGAVPVTAISQPENTSPVRIIFDTDMWSDIDDVLALAMLHALQDRGEARLIAITVSTDDKWCAPYINALNTFYGHPAIPIGMVHNGVKGDLTWIPKYLRQVNYTQYISEVRRPNGTRVFPHALRDGAMAPEAVALLRSTLAAQADNSVVIVEVGFSTNLARLMQSKPDHVSPLDGLDLIKKKVRYLSIMAGNFSDGQGHIIRNGQPEFNIESDIPSAQTLFTHWPTELIASGIEVGRSMLFLGSTIRSKFSYVGEHPVVETYEYTDRLYRDYTNKTFPDSSVPLGHLHNHPVYDLTSVLYAVRPDDGYFALSSPGSITVASDGTSRFNGDPNGKQRYLIMNDRQRVRALEAMTSLTSQPPLTKY